MPFDLLKVDVDNCDVCFVEAILLASLRPRMIHVEINTFVPPPIVFRPTEVDRNLGNPFQALRSEVQKGFGNILPYTSLAAWVEVLEPFGYELIKVDSMDAVFVE